MTRRIDRSHEASGRLCPLIGFSRMAGGKYKLRILWELTDGPSRYGKIRRSVVVACQGKPVTPRVLSRELKDLEQRGLIHRTQYPVVPPKVEYRLTDLGAGLIPIVRQIIKWGRTGAHERASSVG